MVHKKSYLKSWLSKKWRIKRSGMEKKIENYQFGSYDGLKCKPWMNLNTCYASDNYTCRIVAQKEKKERVIDTTTVNLS